MYKILKSTTQLQLQAQDYCNAHNIDIDITSDSTGWAVWITFPDGSDKVYNRYVETKEQIDENYWMACEHAAGYWWNYTRNIQVPQVPKPPNVLQVPRVPQLPKVPRVPKVPQFPKVPQSILSVPKIPTIN